MKTFLVAVIFAALTMPAYFQGMSGGKRHQREPKTEDKKQKPDDSAYTALLDLAWPLVESRAGVGSAVPNKVSRA